jgi:Holliday junction DNA helicase RuvA
LFDHIAGELVRKDLTLAVLRAGGVGYAVSIPVSTYEALPANGPVIVYTHLAVRENEMRLFGFATALERELFLILIGAQGIGPSTALAIMSNASPENLVRAVADEDYEALEMIRGIGPKTARRIVAEIKEDVEDFRKKYLGPTVVTGLERDAVLALVSLGYPKNAAQQAVKKARAENPAAGVEELVRVVLRSSGG